MSTPKKKRSPQSPKGRDRKGGKAKVPPESRKKPGGPVGNQFWKARSKHGRDKIFSSPEILLEACKEYFEWVEANPLYEARPFAYQGKVIQEKVAKMRAMTIGGLCIFLDIDRKTWDNYRADNDFFPVINQVEEIIRDQKFTGAAADLLNPNIIARDLGLKDGQEHTGPGNGPVLHSLKVEFVKPK